MPQHIPTATWEGAFTVLGVRLRCYIVDGVRIVNADDMDELFLAAHDPPDPTELLTQELERFAAWRNGADFQ